MNDLAVWAFVVSIITAIGSLWSHVLNTRRFRMLKRQEDDRLADNKKAAFSLKRSTAPNRSKRGYKDILIIENIGKAQARNLYFFVDGKPANKQGLIIGDSFPETLQPNNPYEFLLVIGGHNSPPWKIRLIWDDDYEERREFETTVN